jgi:MFS family permease
MNPEKPGGTAMPGASPQGGFPPGLHHAYYFSAFNALSFQIVLGSPMVLYAKSLDASATTLGVIAGMMPLLVIFQIPAANYIPRMGFKRFVFAGWGIRVLFIFGMALVPVTSLFLSSQTRLVLMLALLFFFNLSRGISSCAWLPWITALIPANLRGKYLATDAGVQNLASFFAFLIAAGCLAGRPGPWQFAALFLFSAVTGAISLSFLKRMPDAEVPEEIQTRAGGGVPWMAMAGYDPFRRLLLTIVAHSVAYGGIMAFTVAFLRNEGMSEGKILLLSSVAFIGGLSSLWLLGSRLDRVGSKPILTFSYSSWALVLIGWLTLSGNLLPVRISLVLVLQFAMGLLAAVAQMSHTRLAMAVIPVMGRNHFFAIYSVMANVTLGMAPIGWGMIIDLVGERAPVWMGISWNRFTVFFGAVAVCWVVTLVLGRRLHEPHAVSMEEMLRQVFSQLPLRFVARLWPRA